MKTSCALFLLFAAVTFTGAHAQSAGHEQGKAEVAVTYTYIHSNAPPSGCGCFNWNGGTVAGAWHFSPQWSVGGEFGGAHAEKIAGSSLSPTLTTFLFGPRYSFARGSHRAAPFADVMLGGAHGSNGYFPNGTSSSSAATSFAFAAGGGIDFSVGRHVAIRAVDADYLFTGFPNGVNGRQNNFRIRTGLVLRFGGR